MKTTVRRDRGSMLIVAIVAVIVLTGISMAYFATSLNQSRKTFEDSLLARAVYVATCGINAAIVDVNGKNSGNLDGNAYYPDTVTNRTSGTTLFTNAPSDPFYATGTRPLDVPPRATYALSAHVASPIGLRPSGDFTTTAVLNANGTYTVTSSGVFDRKIAVLQAVLKKNPTSVFTFAAFGKDGVGGNGGIFTDSYDSRKGTYASQAIHSYGGITYANAHGDLGSNGSITVNGSSATVFGNVSPGPAGTFTAAGTPTIIGSTANLPTVRNLPSYVYQRPTTFTDLGSFKNGTITAGTYVAAQIDGKILINGNVKVYLEGNSSFTGMESIEISSGSSLEVYVKEGVSVKFAGQGVVNASGLPENFKIYSASKEDLDLTGNATLAGVVYAPDSDIKISGNGASYGAIVGRYITLCGAGGDIAGFHYDEALAETMGTITKYAIQSMRQTLTQSY
jgi:hypothetical protein